MTLDRLVALLYTAHQNFTSIELDWRYRYIPAVMDVAQQRWLDMNPRGSVAMLTSTVPHSTPTAEVEVQRQLWYQKPDCWREEEHTADHHRRLTILCENRWWSFTSRHKVLYTNVSPKDAPANSRGHVEHGQPPDIQDVLLNVPLLDPSFLLVSHALEILGTQHHAGREAIQVRATYQKRQEYLHEAFFWATANAYHLLVDKEYGILLRYAAQLNGMEYAISDVERVVFDAPIPPKTFVFAQ